MHNSLASHPGTAKSVRITNANRLRRLIVAACVLALSAIGVRLLWDTKEFADRLLTLYLTLGPAMVYGFGYFYCLPEVLGSSVAQQRRTSRQRWSDFARLSAALAVSFWIAWCIASLVQNGLPHSSDEHTGEILKGLIAWLAITLLPAFLIFAFVAASEEYLAPAMTQSEATNIKGFRSVARRLVGRIGSTIAQSLRGKRALSLGSTLVLASLLLNITLMGNCGSDPQKGHEILSGKAVWITAQYSVRNQSMKALTAQLGRWSYLLSLLISVVCLLAVLIGPRGDRVRRSRVLAVLTGALALLAICDFTFGWVRVIEALPEPLVFAIFGAAWILPVTLWLWRARNSEPQQLEYTRLAIMIALLPAVFFTAEFGIFIAFFDTPDLYGLASFLFGLMLLWWGLVQSEADVEKAELL